MNPFTCENVRPLLPEWARGVLSASESEGVGAHLAACEKCAAESELLGLLRRARPEPAEQSAARIQAVLRRQVESHAKPLGSASEGPGGEPWWWAPLRRPGLAAAAVIVLALGTAVIWPQVRGGPALPDTDADIEAPLMVDLWASDDGIVAGAPVLEELSDEQLLMLLQELEG